MLRTGVLLTFLFITYFLASVASALNIILPLPHTLWFADTNVLVTWNQVGINLTQLQVNLAQGQDENALTNVATLASNVNAADGSIRVRLPSNVASGSNYYIVLEGNDNPPSRATKGPFIIAFGSGSSSSAPPSSSSPPITTGGGSSTSNATSSDSSSSASQPSSTSPASKTITPPNTASSSDASSETSTAGSDEDGSNGSGNGSDLNTLAGGQIAGIVVGVAGALGVTAAALLWARRRRRNDQPSNDDAADYFSQPAMTSHQDNISGGGYYVDNNNGSGFGMAGVQPRFAPTPPPPQASYYPHPAQQHQQSYYYNGTGAYHPPPAAAAVATGQPTQAYSDKPHSPESDNTGSHI